MVSVIIPTLNEEKSIAKIVIACKACPLVSEVIVVDDNSEDDTRLMAEESGAIVFTSCKRGKGISMREGLDRAVNEVVVFLDGDIYPYPDQTIENLAGPLLRDEADFVKGSFGRNAGRVTTLVAKPLLSIFYPELGRFDQPLSGMIAGRKQLFDKLTFYNDYGVDIGILIDMHLMGVRIKEVNIGYIENKSKPWQSLGKMSREVSRAIITKAQRFIPGTVDEDELQRLEIINSEMQDVLASELSSMRKMVVFDMDNTILRGRFIDQMAALFGFTEALAQLRMYERDPVILTKRIGLLLKGCTMEDMLGVIRSIPMVQDTIEVVAALRRQGYLVGIISNSYQLVCDFVRKQIGADFALANRLEFFEGKATGEVNIPSYFFASPGSVCHHGYCKTHALQYACDKYHVSLQNCLVAGDSADDTCMVSSAGKGFAFCTTNQGLRRAATVTIDEPSFRAMLE